MRKTTKYAAVDTADGTFAHTIKSGVFMFSLSERLLIINGAAK